MESIRLATRPHVLLLTLLAALLSACVEETFVVDHVGDYGDVNPGDGICAAIVGFELLGGSLNFAYEPIYGCTLRAAIEEANWHHGLAHIQVPLPENGSEYRFADGIWINGDTILVAADEGVELAGTLHFQSGNSIVSGFTHSSGDPSQFGCVRVYRGFVTLHGMRYLGCVAEEGGAVWVWAGDVTLKDSYVAWSDAYDGHGGGVSNWGRLTVRDTMFWYNHASGGAGGAIYNHHSGTLSMANTIVQNNFEGAVVNEGELTLANVTLMENNAFGLTSVSSGLTNIAGDVTLRNSWLAHNFDGFGGDCLGALVSEGFNLIENDAFGACAFTGATHLDHRNIHAPADQISVPVFGIHTQPVWVPEPGSLTYAGGDPAVPGSSAQACERRDFRGVDRTASARCDIGAVQVSP